MSKPMTNNAFISRLESRSVLALSGEDRVSFLQGLTSNDIDLAAKSPVYTAFLTPQGKYLFDFTVVAESNRLLLECEADNRDDLLRRLGRFILRANVSLEDVDAHYAVYAAWNGSSNHPNAYPDPRLASLGERIVVRAEEKISTNATEIDYRLHRYQLGIAEGHHEIMANKAVLLELNFDALNGMSLTKGCYMGQELTARTHYRGLVKKRYLPFRFDGLQAPEKHHILVHEGFELGEVMAIQGEYGLGLFNLERIKPFAGTGTPFIYEGTNYYVDVPVFLKDRLG